MLAHYLEPVHKVIELKIIIIDYFKDFNPVRVALFGSFARDENSPLSDIDIPLLESMMHKIEL